MLNRFWAIEPKRLRDICASYRAWVGGPARMEEIASSLWPAPRNDKVGAISESTRATMSVVAGGGEFAPEAMSVASGAAMNTLAAAASEDDIVTVRAESGRVMYQRLGDIAVVPMIGPIEKRSSVFGGYFGFASTMQVQAAVETAANDPDIHAIVILCDSPGGDVDGLADCADAIYKARQKKTVVAQVQGMCASAAYQLCSQASEIWCGRMDLIGSIGVLSVVYDWSKAFEQEGIRTIVISTGEQKGAGVMGAPVSDAHEKEFQRIVDTYFADFLGNVARGRGMAEASVKSAADGRVFFADEAKGLKLIDGVRSFGETMAALRGGERGRSTQAARKRLELMG